MKRLEGKTAIVFGAGPNIGGAIAHFLAREGARVAIADRSAAAAEESAGFLAARGFEAVALAGDALVEADVERMIAEAVRRFGQLDIAVNMAGTVHWCSVLDMDLAAWNQAVLSYPTAGMLTTKHAARAMIARGTGGSIIHLLSTAAYFGEADAAAYCAAKAALLNLARSAAMDLAHHRVRVNTITPCGMEHNLWTIYRDEAADPNFVPPAQTSAAGRGGAAFYSREDYLRSIPLARFPRAADLAWAAVYLASDEASFVTGADIAVDGGLRFKYPVWRPGDHTGVNIRDYARNVRITEYGEERGPVIPE